MTVSIASRRLVQRTALCELSLKPHKERMAVDPCERCCAVDVHRLAAWAHDGVQFHAKLQRLLWAYRRR